MFCGRTLQQQGLICQSCSTGFFCWTSDIQQTSDVLLALLTLLLRSLAPKSPIDLPMSGKNRDYRLEFHSYFRAIFVISQWRESVDSFSCFILPFEIKFICTLINLKVNVDIEYKLKNKNIDIVYGYKLLVLVS